LVNVENVEDLKAAAPTSASCSEMRLDNLPADGRAVRETVKRA
jgi:hypothetical protein